MFCTWKNVFAKVTSFFQHQKRILHACIYRDIDHDFIDVIYYLWVDDVRFT